ncbi:hypothetical protein Tsubulata_033918, partial [Turnera subulata]
MVMSVSFSSTMAAIPKVFKRLFVNFLWVSLLMPNFTSEYLIFLFAFSLLSTFAVVFTVTSFYSSKPVSSSSTMAAIPKVFKRLFVTFLWVSLLMLVYNSVFLVLLIIVVDTQSTLLVDTQSTLLVFLCLVQIFVHVYITALSHLASVVSVLEPIYGFAAMKKRSSSRERPASWRCSSSGYLSFCGLIAVAIGSVVVHGGD